MSPALNGSSAIWHFEGSDAIEIRDRITFDFYTGLPQIENYKRLGNEAIDVVYVTLASFPAPYHSYRCLSHG